MEWYVLITNNLEQQTITLVVKKWICISYSLIIINRSYASNATSFSHI